MLLRRTRFFLCGTLLAAGITSTTASFALSDEERAGARAAANQGADDFDQGKWAEAVDMFSRAEAIVHSPIHLSYIARAQLKLGHWVEAYELFNRVKREQPTPPVPAPIATAIADASKQLAKLDEEMPSVTLNVKGADAKTASVTMDGVAVPSALIGLYHPVNPGVHRFRATAGSSSSNEVTVDVKPSSRQSVDLVLAAPGAVAPIAPVPAATAPVAAAAPVATPGAPPPEAPTEPPTGGDSAGKGLRIGGYVALGVGVVGVGLGTVFLLSASSKQKQGDDAFAACAKSSCTVPQRGAIDSLDSKAASGRTLAFTSYLVGGVGVATGITLLVLAGKHGSSETTAHVEPWIGYQSAGLSGTF